LPITLHIEKKTLRETQTLTAGCSKTEPKISPVADPLPGGAGQPKFNHLQTQFGED